MSKSRLPGSKIFDSRILMYYCTLNNDISLAKEFKKYMSKEHHKYEVTDQVKFRNVRVKENVHTQSIIIRMILMFHKNV